MGSKMEKINIRKIGIVTVHLKLTRILGASIFFSPNYKLKLNKEKLQIHLA